MVKEQCLHERIALTQGEIVMYRINLIDFVNSNSAEGEDGYFLGFREDSFGSGK